MKPPATVFPAHNALLLPALVLVVLIGLSLHGDISRWESYELAPLVLLYLPFTLHSVSVEKEGIRTRHCIIPRRRLLRWEDIESMGYRLNYTRDVATLSVRLKKRRFMRKRLRFVLDLSKEAIRRDFEDFVASKGL